ncbi:DNA mismatch endonuclease Vsr [Macrococcus equipercicus]|uniref:Very short patch repair endonuclease n=1 Tax=Macrococcus equipercicus TaxID=69967 RepID=A0ABQ6R639_9STAP|nr:very short patch repair endonuclease [Macrococcus equipercicus]KAA1035687.1 DNA mismatch endonuclease Vsr [Macrococcus equipercicus]
MKKNEYPSSRSYNMSRIKGKNSKPEETVRKYLYQRGFRYRKNYSRLPGSPDIYLPKYNTAIFVNGCFWHVHGCGKFKMPKSNQEFWQAKFNRNVARDEKNIEELTEMGVKVIVIWECGLENEIKQETLEELEEMIVNEEEDMKLREFFLSCDWEL